MIEVKCVGRGGQGAVTFSQILAIAAFYDKKECQAFPTFGVERRGAPSFSFTRISDKKITLRSEIYDADIVVILDSSLLNSLDLAKGIKKNGMMIINSRKTKDELNIKGDFKVFAVDVSSVAMKIFKSDMVNTAMLGAFAAITKSVSLDSIYRGLIERFDNNQKIIELNKQAVKEVYEQCLKK